MSRLPRGGSRIGHEGVGQSRREPPDCSVPPRPSRSRLDVGADFDAMRRRARQERSLAASRAASLGRRRVQMRVRYHAVAGLTRCPSNAGRPRDGPTAAVSGTTRCRMPISPDSRCILQVRWRIPEADTGRASERLPAIAAVTTHSDDRRDAHARVVASVESDADASKVFMMSSQDFTRRSCSTVLGGSCCSPRETWRLPVWSCGPRIRSVRSPRTPGGVRRLHLRGGVDGHRPPRRANLSPC